MNLYKISYFFFGLASGLGTSFYPNLSLDFKKLAAIIAIFVGIIFLTLSGVMKDG